MKRGRGQEPRTSAESSPQADLCVLGDPALATAKAKKWLCEKDSQRIQRLA